MNLISLFRTKRTTAPVARDRLQVLLAHERSVLGKSDLIATLQEEILAVIAKHISVDRDAVQIKLDRGASVSMLEIDVEVPAPPANKPSGTSGPSVPASV
ncbi:MAG: cell division topological specificity factor MinE [Rhodospirillales bacterium 20-64-7]|nr:MAG: cell division topological specificity factor MinE [Rhodospirillales bacterium 20-64-7]HQT78270.1 cell division topological specificity factor MinE [Rhodopila sp.]